jgi:hypothetical protein
MEHRRKKGESQEAEPDHVVGEILDGELYATPGPAFPRAFTATVVAADLGYVSLEAPDTREYATEDPRGFLAELTKGAVIDEVQRAPALSSYLQEEVDPRPRPDRFVLTGSAHLSLLAGVSQTLAGRTGLLTLLPFGLDELRGFKSAPRDRDATLWSGAFPAVRVPGDVARACSSFRPITNRQGANRKVTRSSAKHSPARLNEAGPLD